MSITSLLVILLSSLHTKHNGIIVHCQGNPFITQTPLNNVVSSILIPEGAAKADILDLQRNRHKATITRVTIVCLGTFASDYETAISQHDKPEDDS